MDVVEGVPFDAHDEKTNTVLELEQTSPSEDIDHEAEKRVLQKVDYTLLPMLCLLLITAFLDRTNIGNARIQGLEKDLQMKGSDYNIALFVFFIPYVILDIPSNMLMKRCRPSLYLSSLMFCWGIVTIGEGLTKSYAGLLVCRVLLGALEAGYFPGAIYLLSMYYTRYELHARMNIYYSAGILSSAFGGLFAYAIAHMDGVGGYAGWRWIFILEGIITLLVALLSFWRLPDWPEQTNHLTEAERKVLFHKLSRDTREFVETRSMLDVLKDCLRDPKVLFCGLMYFGTAVTGSSSSYFLPTILKQLGWTSLKAQYMSIPIWMCAWVISITIGFVSDAVKIRWVFCVGPLCFSVIGYGLLLAQKHVSVGVRFMALFFVVSGCFAAITVSLTWINNNIVGTKRRGISTAILLALGNCGSVLGSNVYLTQEAPYYPTGYAVALATTVIAQVSAICYFVFVRHENRQKESGARDHLLSLPDAEQNMLGDKHPAYRYTY